MWLFITVFTTAYNSLYPQYILSCPVSASYILILFFNLRLRVSSVPLSFRFPHHIPITYLSSSLCVCVSIFIYFFYVFRIQKFDSFQFRITFETTIFVLCIYLRFYWIVIHPEALLVRGNTTFSNKHTLQYFQWDSNP